MGKEFLLKLKSDKRLLGIVLLVVLLPFLVVSAFVVTRFRPKAEFASKPTNITTERVSGTGFRISFVTDLEVRATVDCSIGIDGAQFRCAEDSKATITHDLSNQDLDPPVNLNPGTGYYVRIHTGLASPTLAYIPAAPDNRLFSLSFNSFTEDALWLCQEDEGFDPALDVNQDGCVNLLDMAELYSEE
ncbi:hypothetical protein A3H80_01535 [Candidatus Roizmanbacteria bacterium RIFCSPLOWO2_02_FULL_37_19]|uniref:Uncharacterized protein n=1 Tax=Candidatus Roizmanbacteria bacterium RIFCSPHIGHO2_02_FULL_37_24 TaxID=1802037 RepID=A0A1F7H037_9BACT|nr:MAG: hypothetical protein A2862_03385 [Candidatus Roizmanbacteria bacterium RIFCSPHIGHO2_01_FULL_38_41]OGK24601.1 MAG: hypothetical protein A3C24_02315 [Candidatus Roizmanbacteria bacterium RIFCSPHIGHO2_02_FULL_37_24]OGK32239.1 MAG: hypothetical protein A3E10_02255 [Candidatus Roizmanbacteria bacterium RIFCSPHIGHO2_12_FULL_37_23]OGK44832.1 MAG: hypothetical protein A2956_04325 [Candidatus Roizmanbacteria bacterium RIFCSPLOWO2_01_FULL_37_57]OGK53872.1 MAG: hypothetical protein A3H80_01535 [Ca